MCVSQYQYDWEIQIYACIATPTCSPLGVGSSQIPPGTGSLSWRGLCVCTKLLSGSAVEETHSELSHGLLTVLNQLLMEVMNRWSNNYKLLVDITQLLKSPGGNCAMTWLRNRLRAPHGWNSHDGRFVATIRNIMKWSGSQKESFADMCSKHLISFFCPTFSLPNISWMSKHLINVFAKHLINVFVKHILNVFAKHILNVFPNKS